MARETDFPSADELLRQFEQAVSDYFSENRPSGTMDIPNSPKVVNGYFGKQIRGIRFVKDSNVIEVY